jgi:stage II sporulation protein D
LLIAASADAETLRIGLVRSFKDTSEVTIGIAAGGRITARDGRTFALAPGEKVTVRKRGSEIELVKPNAAIAAAGPEVTAAPSSPDSLIEVCARGGPPASYRGSITAQAGERGLALTNAVETEDYVLGVMAAEAPASYSAEALKAQAVVCRSYALANRGKHGAAGYDLCDSVHCQLYLGASGEKPSLAKAVRDTAGLVMRYQGQLVSAQYCGDCGGMTQRGSQPYLVSVRDSPDEGGPDYCEGRSHRWTKTWPLADLEKLLRKAYPDLKGLRSLSVTQADCSGRAVEVAIEAEQGSTVAAGDYLRGILGYTVIRSTLFTVRVEDGAVTFDGKGFGHGIGLCQAGANGLASPPYNWTFDRILQHYYGGVEIGPFGDPGTQRTSRSPASAALRDTGAFARTMK